jgi:tetratricopeptide (TPR) repeat protein
VESIAVIPFVNQDNNANAEWISDGLTESIINNLTQLPNLKVIARSSVFRYKGKEVDPLAVGKELDPNFPTAHFFLGRACEAKGMYDEAVREYTTAAAVTLVPPDSLAKMNEAYHKSGWKAYVQTATQELVERRTNKPPPFVIATYYARLGDKEQTYAWLQKGLEERDFRMTLLAVSFEFDPFRSDPRFQAFIRKLGLPE